MTLGRVVGLCGCIVISSDAAAGQQSSNAPATTVIERVHAAGSVAPWRRVHVRTDSASREVIVDTVEMTNIEGRLAPAHETIVETNRPAPNTAQTRRAVFWVAPDGRRTLLETTDSLRETLANGDSRAVDETSAPDLNGHRSVTSRQIEETRSTADVRETRTTRLLPDVDNSLRAAERTESTERMVTPGLVRYDSTQLVRDVNGRWQPIEVHRGETTILASERLEDATIQRRDLNGTLAVEERRATRVSTTNGREHLVIEIRAPYADGSSPWALSERVQRTTTPTADGGRHTVEEAETRNGVAPSDPLRVSRRTVTTVRHTGSGRWVTERQFFELDANGRLVLTGTEEEDRQD